jgi:hypothetical protein
MNTSASASAGAVRLRPRGSRAIVTSAAYTAEA